MPLLSCGSKGRELTPAEKRKLKGGGHGRRSSFSLPPSEGGLRKQIDQARHTEAIGVATAYMLNAHPRKFPDREALINHIMTVPRTDRYAREYHKLLRQVEE